MQLVGWILVIVGGVPFLLDCVGMLGVIPALVKMNVPTGVWGGIGVVGIVIAMMTRRPRS
ncbi:MAG: hypothetical protein HZB26_06675 [Candidatus Hydrogenedentes bacterium]|nr:hypothetical protein [Candidatus Hydrogenedentota bacterium]